MLSEEDMKEIEKAKSNILRGNDIESASLILEKVILDNLIIVGGRVDIIKVAVRQILNFIEEYKDKGYLDVVREKVKANEEIAKLQKENEEKDKQIDLMAYTLQDNLYLTPLDGLNKEELKQYFETKAKKGE